MNEIKKLFKIFVLSSSLPVFLITLSYIGLSFRGAGRPSNVPYELFPLFIPFIFGIFGIINYFVIKKFGINSSLFVGVALALVLSFIGRFMLNLPEKIFKFTKKNVWTVHIIAMILYSLIVRFILTPIIIHFV